MRVFSQQVPVEVVVIVQVTGVALITFIFGYFFSIEVITLITICTLLSGFVFWLKQEDDAFGLIDLLMWSYAVFLLLIGLFVMWQTHLYVTDSEYVITNLLSAYSCR